MKKSDILFVNTQEIRCGRCGSHIRRGDGNLRPDCIHMYKGFSTDYTAHPYTTNDAWCIPTGPTGLGVLPFIPRTDIEFDE